MAKLFTITEGLENMGALKMGGQGSVYKGRRENGVITAIKLLPTPIHSESEDDKNYRDFRNEVEKLKRVNQSSSPHVVRILSSGVTDTGNFPFIEMEFIEGPELEELLKPPHEPVFLIQQAIKVAEHLSNAIAHCHHVEVKHGDIKSNNVKYNIQTANYVLLDFGLAIMSDEQRRTSLRHAGAIEFMAPEQNEGKMLYETDVYSFGIVMFELLAGTVPFPLKDKSERSRNAVMLAHMETQPPSLLALRKQHMPADWPASKKEQELRIPSWMMVMISKCLAKDPAERFANGKELYRFIKENKSGNKENLVPAGFAAELKEDNLKKENQELLQTVSRQKQEIAELRANLDQQLNELQQYRYSNMNEGRKGVPAAAFYILLLISTLLAAFAAYTIINGNDRDAMSENNVQLTDTSSLNQNPEQSTEPRNETGNESRPEPEPQLPVPPPTDPLTYDTAPASADSSAGSLLQQYSVISRAYFHNEPNEGSRRDAYMIPSNEVITALEDRNGFIYVEFTNPRGQTSKGWLKKSDLVRAN